MYSRTGITGGNKPIETMALERLVVSPSIIKLFHQPAYSPNSECDALGVLEVALTGGQRLYSPILFDPRKTSFDLRFNLIARDLASSCKSPDVHCLFCHFVVL